MGQNYLQTQHLYVLEQEELDHRCRLLSGALLFATAGLKSEMQVGQPFPAPTIICPWVHHVSFTSLVLSNLF